LVYRLIIASPSRRMTNRPWKGRGYVTWHVLNFGGPIHISGMAEARALIFCTKADYIKSCQRDDKSPLKGAWFCSSAKTCHIKCATVDLEKIFSRHSVICDQPCPRQRTTDYHIVDSRRWYCHTLRLKLHRFNLSPCLLQTCLCNI